MNSNELPNYKDFDAMKTFFKSGLSVTHAPHGVGDVGAQVVEPTLAALLADAAAAHEPRDVGPALGA